MDFLKDFGLSIRNINNINKNNISITGNFLGVTFIEELSIKNSEIYTDIDKITNIAFKKIIDQIFFDNKDFSLRKIYSENNNINITSLDFLYKGKSYIFNIDWIRTKEIEEFEVPYLQDHYIGQYIDKKTLSILIDSYKSSEFNSDKETNKSIIYLYINTILINRILFIFSIITNIITTEEIQEKLNLSFKEKSKIYFSKKIKNKKIKFKIVSSLSDNFEFKCDIEITVSKNKYFIYKDSTFKKEEFLNCYKDIFGSDSFEIKSSFLNADSKKNKDKFDIINSRNRKFKKNILIKSNLKNLYQIGEGFVFNKETMEVEESLSPEELNILIKKYIFSIF